MRNRKDRKKEKTKMLLLLVGILLGLCLIGGGLFLVEQRLNPEIEAEDEEDEDDSGITLMIGDDYYHTDDRIETYLFMGTDYSAQDDEEHNPLADFLLLAVVNKTEDTYGFLQIDRNTMTDVYMLDKGERPSEDVQMVYEQICTAHWYGDDSEIGCENTVCAVSGLLGELEIDGYYALSMAEISKINHVVGGVEVTLEDDFTDVDPKMKPGKTLVLTDEQAEHYLHDRMTMEDDTNVNRMARQTQYMHGFSKKLKEKIKDDPKCVNDILKDFQDVSETNISNSKLTKLVNEMYKGEDLGILNLEGETKLGTTLDDGEEHEEFYPTDESIAEVLCKLLHMEKETEAE